MNAKGIDYARLSSLLIEAVKEQQAEIDRQRQEIDALRKLMCSSKTDAEICKSREK